MKQCGKRHVQIILENINESLIILIRKKELDNNIKTWNKTDIGTYVVAIWS